MRVAVLDDWQGLAETYADWTALKARADVLIFRDTITDPDALAERLRDFDVILAMRERTPLLAPLLGRLPRLRLISFTGPRNNSVDTAAATAQGVLVCNTLATRSSHATAELALALLLGCARTIAQGDAEIRAGRFQEHLPGGTELHGATLGLIGLGRIGGRMARYGQALGMKIIAWSQNLTDERVAEVGAVRVTKDELLSTADAISIHLVLSDRSRGVVGPTDIARMKPGAIIVNTSRAALIDQTALLAALHARRIRAGLDVYEVEPLPLTDPLRHAPNTVLSPHLGYVTAPNMADFYVAAVENIVAWLDEAPIRVMNPEASANIPA